jgi:tricorn protease
MRKVVLALYAALIPVCLAQSDSLLLRQPTVSKTEVVFTYGGDLWSVARDGGEARRLTSALGTNIGARFSPDGSMIAFTGRYSGNADVYVMPAGGGQPRRLTYHPDSDEVMGWTPDGNSIVFRSTRHSYYHFSNKLFTVPVTGGPAIELPLPIAEQGALSPDGIHLAYVPHGQWQPAWKHYRGQTTRSGSPISRTLQLRRSRAKTQRLQPYVGGEHNLLSSDRNVCESVRMTWHEASAPVVKNDVRSTASAGPNAM